MWRLFILVFSLLLVMPLSSAVVVPAPPATETVLVPTRTELEEQMGRKLKFKERIALKILRGKQKRQLKRQKRLAKKGIQDDASRGNGMAVASFVCGLVGLFVAGILLGALAIVFGAIAMSKAKREGRPLKGLAVAGLILGVVSVVGALIFISML